MTAIASVRGRATNFNAVQIMSLSNVRSSEDTRNKIPKAAVARSLSGAMTGPAFGCDCSKVCVNQAAIMIISGQGGPLFRGVEGRLRGLSLVPGSNLERLQDMPREEALRSSSIQQSAAARRDQMSRSSASLLGSTSCWK